VTISTITIGGVDYTAYASVAEADPYLAVDPVRATAWAALTTDQKGANLVAATRRLDLLAWEGEKAGGASQAEAFPRTGLTYADGTAAPDDEVPQAVEDACILLAGSIAITAATSGAGSSGTNIKSVKAGSAAVEFFRQQDGVPLQDETAYALVREFLDGFSSVGSGTGNYATGTDGESTFSDIDQWGRDRGFP
jgi:hypothetical protein